MFVGISASMYLHVPFLIDFHNNRQNSRVSEVVESMSSRETKYESDK